MFENIINQSAVFSLISDIQNGSLPQAVLFSGPAASGKGSAAMECARVLSCSMDRRWGCLCPSCEAHRLLNTKDLIIIGPRSFGAEITACSRAFLRNRESESARTLFLRSVRKLLMRFSPVIREGESDISKLNTLILALTDAMESFYLADLKSESGGLEKTVDVIVKDALKLEDAGISDTMPAAHIRRASYWLHTSPDGICKTLIIENADRMKDEARNALLKTIEEPPSSCQIILTSARARSLLPTVLSRLRPYSFVTRNRESEIEIIRRVFRESDEGVFLLYKSRASGGGGEDAEFLEGEGSLVSRYLDGFLPVSQDALKPLASLFASCLFSVCSQKALRRGSAEAARFFSLLCESAGACARNAGVFFDGMEEDEVCAFILSKAANFKPSRLFSGFISGLYAVCGEALKKNADGDPVNALAVRFALKKRCEDAVNSVSIYNQSPAAVLYKLFFDLKRDSAGL